jgi:hypothetical protein
MLCSVISFARYVSAAMNTKANETKVQKTHSENMLSVHS